VAAKSHDPRAAGSSRSESHPSGSAATAGKPVEIVSNVKLPARRYIVSMMRVAVSRWTLFEIRYVRSVESVVAQHLPSCVCHASRDRDATQIAGIREAVIRILKAPADSAHRHARIRPVATGRFGFSGGLNARFGCHRLPTGNFRSRLPGKHVDRHCMAFWTSSFAGIAAAVVTWSRPISRPAPSR
jgi:hypothetical protein